MRGNLTSDRIGIVGAAASWALAASLAVLLCASAFVSPAVALTHDSKFPLKDDARIYGCWEYQRYDETGHWYVPGGQPLTTDAMLAKLKGLTAPGTELSDSTPGSELYIKVKTDSHLVARYRRVPCPPPSERIASGFAGFHVGADVAVNFNRLGQTETISGTDVVTNRFNDSSNGVGGGLNAGFLSPVGNGPFLIGPSASFDLMHQDTFHTFPGNIFIGETAKAIGTLNGQIGVVPKPGLLLFGEVGGAVVNIEQKLNFSGPVTSVNRNVTGLNVGFGAAYQPPDWQFAGNRVAWVFQYDHVFLPVTTFNNPGSPGFTYGDSNNINKVTLGLRVTFADNPRSPTVNPLAGFKF